MNLLEYPDLSPTERRTATRARIQQVCGNDLSQEEVNTLEVLLEQYCPRCQLPQLLLGCVMSLSHCQGNPSILAFPDICYHSWFHRYLRRVPHVHGRCGVCGKRWVKVVTVASENASTPPAPPLSRRKGRNLPHSDSEPTAGVSQVSQPKPILKNGSNVEDPER